MKSIKKCFVATTVAFLFLLPCVCLAQPDDADDPPPDDIPFDGGVCLLIAAGVGYGIKKMKKEDKTIDAE